MQGSHPTHPTSSHSFPFPLSRVFSPSPSPQRGHLKSSYGIGSTLSMSATRCLEPSKYITADSSATVLTVNKETSFNLEDDRTYQTFSYWQHSGAFKTKANYHAPNQRQKHGSMGKSGSSLAEFQWGIRPRPMITSAALGPIQQQRLMLLCNAHQSSQSRLKIHRNSSTVAATV